jgi:hypothetical protein
MVARDFDGEAIGTGLIAVAQPAPCTLELSSGTRTKLSTCRADVGSTANTETDQSPFSTRFADELANTASLSR